MCRVGEAGARRVCVGSVRALCCREADGGEPGAPEAQAAPPCVRHTPRAAALRRCSAAACAACAALRRGGAERGKGGREVSGRGERLCCREAEGVVTRRKRRRRTPVPSPTCAPPAARRLLPLDPAAA